MRRILPGVSLAFALVAWPRSASAWVETHVVGDDVRVLFEKDAPARVEHRITVRVAGGPLRVLDLRGVDGDAEPESDAYLVTERDAAAKSLTSAQEITAELLPPDNKPTQDGSKAPSVLRLRLGEKGIGRGTYVVQVRYRTRLVERGFVTFDGTVARIRWNGLAWEDGFDSAKVIFDLPAGPAAPRVEDRAAAGAPDAPLILSTVRRKGDRDEIELLKPYVSVGEAPEWKIIADGRAFGKGTASNKPGDFPMISIAQPKGSQGRFGTLWLAGAAFGFLGWAFLVARKVREVTLTSLAVGAKPAPLLPMPLPLRAPLSAGLLGLAGYLQVVKHAWTPGALALLGAALLVVHKVPGWPKSFFLKKPGKWLSVAERETFIKPVRPKGSYLDVSTLAGKVGFVLGLGIIGGLSWLASQTSRHLGWMVALDAVLVLALFGTGRMAWLPPNPVEKVSPFLKSVADRLGKVLKGDARTVGRIRVPDGASEPDELRLAVIPRPAAQGFRALEVGVVIAPGAGGAALLPGVVLRYMEGSPCEAALGKMIQAGKFSRGKKPGEVAVVYAPRLPTARMTADLAARLARAIGVKVEPKIVKRDVSAKDRARRAA
ncbi:MAG: hypothetical protein IPK82_38215 [Polyangiaceae bacterium]|nr:hypothetical protein [Polyangiaceae bacterium]